jgi:hypothetical protein
MAARTDEANNWIQTEFFVDLQCFEETADYLVKTMNNYVNRGSVRVGGHVRLKHIEMSAAQFALIETLHSHFRAFRMTSYSALRHRGVLGTLCGITVICNDNLNRLIKFQYTDILAQEQDFLIDPFHIASPKAAVSPFLER